VTGTRRRAPYRPGDYINGIYGDPRGGTCLTEGTVTACFWDQDLRTWRVIASMFHKPNLGKDGGTFTKTYLWVNNRGASDYCSPGRMHLCKYRTDVPCRTGCPHSDTARRDVTTAVQTGRDHGYTVTGPVGEAEIVMLALDGHGTRFELTFTWDPQAEVMAFTRIKQRSPGRSASVTYYTWPDAAHQIESATLTSYS
jgi:hypothetical protein